MQRDQIEAKVREIIANYRVNQKFAPGPGRRNYQYAVYAGPNTGRMRPNPNVRQVSEPVTSAEAKVIRDNLIVEDLVSFIESLQESNDVHQE